MADYDLGTARGRIVIDEDTKGANDAARSMAELAIAAKALERAFRSTEGSMARMEGNLQKAAASSQRAAQTTGMLENALSRVTGTLNNVAGEMLGLNTATNNLESSLGKAARTAMELRSSLNDLTSVSTQIKKISTSFIGLDRTMSTMPEWVRSLNRSAAGVVAFGAVASNVLPRVGAAFRGVALAAALMSPAVASAGAAMRPLTSILGGVVDRIGQFGTGVIQAARGVGQMITGAALLKNAFTGIGTAAKFAAIGLGAISAAAAALKFTGSVVLGTANAIKTLSGSFLLLPGVITAFATTLGVAKLGLSGVGDAFKAATKDGEEFDKAIKDMPPTMQAVARAAKAALPAFKNLQEIAGSSILAGFDKDIDAFTKNYMPSLERGVRQVGGGLNSLKNGFRDFVLSPATMRDTNIVFSETSQILNNVARAMWPVLAGLRDVAVVGLQTFSDLTGGIGLAGKKFGDFMAKARASGDLKRWIQDGLDGFRDLGTSIRDTSVAFATIFKAFGSNGDNALERMAAGAAKFRAAMDKSAQGGGLDTVASSLERMANTSMDVITVALNSLLQVMKNIAPFAEAMSNAFGSSLASSLKVVGKAAELVASALSQVSGLGSVVGTIVGMGVAFKALQIAMLPVTRTATAVVGALSLFRGLGNTISGVSTAMTSVGAGARVAGVQMGAFGSAVAGVGSKVPAIAKMQEAFVRGADGAQRFGRTVGTLKAGMSGLQSAASGFMSLIGGPWVAAIGAAIGIIFSFVQQGKDLATLQTLLAEKAQATQKAVQGFTKAFEQANGVMGKDITKEAVRQFDDLQTKIEETSRKGSSTMSDIGAFFKDAFSWSGIKDTLGGDPVPWINNRKNAELDHMGQAAQRAKDSFSQLAMTSDQVGAAISGTDGEWNTLINNLHNTSNGGADAIAQLQPLRDAFVQTRDSMARVGPGAVQLENALKTIADASASAADRLNAMESALRAMGLLQVDAVEAMSQVTEAIKSIDESMQGPIGTSEQLGRALLNASGGLNAMNPAAQELWRRVKPLSESLRDVAASGGDVNGAFAQMQPALEALRQQTGLNNEEWNQLIRTMGLTPDVLTTLVQMKGAPEAVQEIYGLQQALSKVPVNTPVNVFIRDNNVLNTLRNIGASVEVINQTTGEVRIAAPNPEVKAKVDALLQTVQNGATGSIVFSSNIPGVQGQAQALSGTMNTITNQPFGIHLQSNVPQVQSQADALTQMLLGIGKTEIPAPKVDTPQAPPVAPPPAQPPLPAPPVTPPVTPPIQPPPAQPPLPAPPVQQPVVPTPPPPPIPPIPAPPVETPVIPTPPPPELPPMPQPAPIALQITGQDEVIGAINNVNAAIADNASKWPTLVTAVQQAMQGATQALQGFANSVGPALNGAAQNANASGQALGQGFADGINSKVDAVRQAAMNLANAAAAPLPRSPAKIGPFSGTGWTPYRGKSLALGFAKGIEDNQGAAKDASLQMAESVAKAMDGIRTAFNLVPTSFDANRTPGVGGKRYYRDPTVTQQDIDKARADKAAAKAEEDNLNTRFKAYDDQKKLLQQQSKDDRKSNSVRVSGKTDPNAPIVPAIEKIANAFGLALTSGQRDEPGSLHSTGKAGDFSNGVRTDAELAFANFMADNFRPMIKELIYDDPRFNKQIKNGQFVDKGFYANAGDHTNHVHVAMDEAPVVEKGLDKLATNQQKAQDKASEKAAQDARALGNTQDDSKQAIVDAIVAEGQKRGLSDEEIAAGVATGIVESNLTDNIGGPDGSVNVFQQRPSQGWGPPSESVATDAGQFFDAFMKTDPNKTPGQRAQDVQRSAFPDKYDQRMTEAMELTQQSLQRQGMETNSLYSSTTSNGEKQLTTQEEMLKALETGNKQLYDQVQIAQNPNSSDAEVIQALQAIDDEMATTNNRDVYEGLKEVRDAVMQDRGIKQYDPYEGATKDLPGDLLKAAQTVVGLFNIIKNGLTNATQTFDLLARGISNTKELNQVIDGFQSMASTVGEVVSSIGEIINVVASVAALAGAAIPGIGQVAAVVSGITGGISAVNSVIDLIQEVASIGGMFLGGFLSMIAGGANGPLMGDVRVLLDLNDNTIKTWSDDNPQDKRVHSLGDPWATQNNSSQSIGINQLQIYQGPGQSTGQVLNDVMFATRTARAGAY